MENTAPARTGRRPRDMALSMIVLLVPVFLVVVFYRFLGNESPPAVDPTPAYQSAQRAGAFEVLTPQGLPKGWRIAVAEFRSGALRIGVNTDDGGALQVVQTAAAVDTAVPDEVGSGATPGATVEIDGAQWRHYTGGRPGERAIVLATSGRTVVVQGKGSEAELRTLAGSLKPR